MKCTVISIKKMELVFIQFKSKKANYTNSYVRSTKENL